MFLDFIDIAGVIKESEETGHSIYDLLVQADDEVCLWLKRLERHVVSVGYYQANNIFKSELLYMNHLNENIKYQNNQRINVEAAKEYDIERLAENLGLEVIRHKVRSIYKEERTPSMHLYIKSNRYKCFSTGKYGDNINLVQDCLGLDFISAVKYINNII